MFSINYFFILYKTDSSTIRSVVLFAYYCVIVGLAGVGVATNMALSKSKCGTTSYGVANRIASFILIGVAVFLFLVSTGIGAYYKSAKKLPECLVKEDEEPVA